MIYRVELSPEAEADLLRLSDYIATESGRGRAQAYTRRILQACTALQNFPARGARRDDLRPGVRTIGFERRATIAYTFVGELVTVLRILYGGRDLEAAFNDENT